jgi:putative transposase
MLINRAYKFRIYPNLKQQKQLYKEFAAAKVVYNYYLEKSTTSYQNEGKKLNFYDWCRDLTKLKKEEQYAWLKEVGSQNLINALRDLDAAFKNFFRRVKEGAEEKGYPNAKKFNSSVRYNNQSCAYFHKKHKISLSKVGEIRVVDYKYAFGKLMNITVSKSKDGKWYASLCVEQNVKPYQSSASKQIGIDMGIKNFLTDSDGNTVPNPHYYVKSQQRRTLLQRRLDKKKRGSKNRSKARIALAKHEAKIAAQRANFIHQISTHLVKENQFIAHEDLSVKNMLRNHHLAKHIADAGWSEFLRMLNYKGQWYQCRVVKIKRFDPSSKVCHVCGYKNNTLTLNDRKWICPQCDTLLDRDVNAAINIRNWGLQQELAKPLQTE